MGARMVPNAEVEIRGPRSYASSHRWRIRLLVRAWAPAAFMWWLLTSDAWGNGAASDRTKAYWISAVMAGVLAVYSVRALMKNEVYWSDGTFVSSNVLGTKTVEISALTAANILALFPLGWRVVFAAGERKFVVPATWIFPLRRSAAKADAIALIRSVGWSGDVNFVSRRGLKPAEPGPLPMTAEEQR